MPIFEYCCNECGKVFESLEIWSYDKATKCKICGSEAIERIISCSHIRMDSDSVKKSLPDPVPPLRELVGKNKKGTEGGFKELESDKRELREYDRVKDKHGNNVWLPKRRKYFHK